MLPASYAKADAVFNVQRAALLMAALATGDRHAFPTALEDRMHQPYRCGLVPGLAEILKLRAPGLLGCTLSGAGPRCWCSMNGDSKMSATWCGRFLRRMAASRKCWRIECRELGSKSRFWVSFKLSRKQPCSWFASAADGVHGTRGADKAGAC